MSRRLEIVGLKLPLIEGKVDLAKMIVDAALEQGVGIEEGDVVVVTSKFALKSYGLLVKLSEIKPGLRAAIIHAITGKNPVETELVLRNSRRVLFVTPVTFLKDYVDRISTNPREAIRAIEAEKLFMFVEMRNGIIASEAGVDFSNVPPGYAVTSNYDFDAIARDIRRRIREYTGIDVAVVIADTEFFASNGKLGSIDIAVGSSGIDPITRKFGEKDLYGRPKFGGLDILIDEVCAAAALIMRQSSEGIPVVIIRGLSYEKSERGVKDVLVTQYKARAAMVLLKVLLLNLLFRALRLI